MMSVQGPAFLFAQSRVRVRNASALQLQPIFVFYFMFHFQQPHPADDACLESPYPLCKCTRSANATWSKLSAAEAPWPSPVIHHVHPATIVKAPPSSHPEPIFTFDTAWFWKRYRFRAFSWEEPSARRVIVISCFTDFRGLHNLSSFMPPSADVVRRQIESCR